MAEIVIDSVHTIMNDTLFISELDAIKKLKRSLELAISVKDVIRIEKTRDLMLSYEDSITQDDKPGLWGFCARELLDNKIKTKLSSEQEKKIIESLEGRLQRVSSDRERLHLNSTHHASLLLAKYYRSQKQPENLKRVLDLYKNTFIDAAKKMEPLASSVRLKEVYDTLLNFGLKKEANSLTKEIQQYGEQSIQTLQKLEFSYNIPMEEFQKSLETMLSGTFEEIIMRFCGTFLPNLTHEREALKKNAQEFIFSNLVTVYLKDKKGRTIAEVGSYDSDPEGRLIYHISQKLQFNPISIHETIKALKGKYGSELLGNLIDCIYNNSIFDQNQKHLLEKGLKAYLEEDYIVAIHLLVPQIEHTIRNFIDILTGEIYKKGDLGSISLKSLDTLLNEECLQNILTERITTYLKLILTDKRGWNLRNDICHALKTPQEYDYKSADRLFHIIILLMHVKETTNT